MTAPEWSPWDRSPPWHAVRRLVGCRLCKHRKCLGAQALCTGTPGPFSSPKPRTGSCLSCWSRVTGCPCTWGRNSESGSWVALPGSALAPPSRDPANAGIHSRRLYPLGWVPRGDAGAAGWDCLWLCILELLRGQLRAPPHPASGKTRKLASSSPNFPNPGTSPRWAWHCPLDIHSSCSQPQKWAQAQGWAGEA